MNADANLLAPRLLLSPALPCCTNNLLLTNPTQWYRLLVCKPGSVPGLYCLRNHLPPQNASLVPGSSGYMAGNQLYRLIPASGHLGIMVLPSARPKYIGC